MDATVLISTKNNKDKTMNVTNLMIKPALFAVYVALVFSFIGCVVNPINSIASTIDQNWRQTSALPSSRSSFQSVLLPNDDILVMGGQDNSGFLNDICRSSDGGSSWQEINPSNHWSPRTDFQAVVLANNDILVMGGYNNGYLNDIWLSKDSGRNWSQIPASNNLWYRSFFQAVVLNNGDLLVMGGHSDNLSYALPLGDLSSAIFLSKDGGTNWSQIPASNHWSPRADFQAVVLANNDILVIGGRDKLFVQDGTLGNNEVWLSKDGGSNWGVVNESAPWSGRYGFQSVVLNNGDILNMGGHSFNVRHSVISSTTTVITIITNTTNTTSVTNTTNIFIANTVINYGNWLSSDGGISWNLLHIPPVNINASGGSDFPPIHATSRYDFQAVVLENNEVLIIGGRNRDTSFSSDVWMRQF